MRCRLLDLDLELGLGAAEGALWLGMAGWRGVVRRKKYCVSAERAAKQDLQLSSGAWLRSFSVQSRAR